MRKITGAAFQSLDGVMQAPGGPTEDPTGGFDHGGWLFGIGDDGIDPWIGALFDQPFDLLLGRRTYDIFAAYWPYQGEGEVSAIAAVFNKVAKYVVTGSDQPLDWQNSHRLGSIDAVRELKARDGPDLLIQGSSTLYPQLLAAGLIDRLVLMTFPLVLGDGKRLFGEGTPPVTLRRIDHQVSPGGTIMATYEPAGPVRPGVHPAPSTSDAEQVRQQRIKDGEW